MLVPLSLLIFAAAPAPKTWTFKTSTSPKVSVSNISGSISVESTSGDQVLVEAKVLGSESSPWTVEAESSGDEVKVRACCGACNEHPSNCGSSRDPVEIIVKAPEKSALRLKSVAASINVRGIKGSESLKSVSGPIEVAGTGNELELHSVSGDIKLTAASIEDTKIRTGSGDVHLKLPKSPDVKVRLKTVSGRLNKAEHPLGTAERVFGKGSKEIDIHTVSGSVDTDPTI